MRRLLLNAAVAGTIVVAAVVRPLLSHDEAPPHPGVESDAVTALNRMAAYLRELKAFQVDATISNEDVLEDGQKLQFDSRVSALAVRPNRLRLSLRSDRKERTFFFDGKTFTMWAPRLKYYATVSAPPTIIELADTLEAKFDIDLPLTDLFRWGAPGGDATPFTAARSIGPGVVLDVTCEQYAFRQEGLDWQVWIQQGDHPLPRKVVITTLTDEARPQYTVVYTWNLAPAFNDSTFVFDPPSDAHKIALVGDEAAQIVKNKK